MLFFFFKLKGILLRLCRSRSVYFSLYLTLKIKIHRDITHRTSWKWTGHVTPARHILLTREYKKRVSVPLFAMYLFINTSIKKKTPTERALKLFIDIWGFPNVGVSNGRFGVAIFRFFRNGTTDGKRSEWLVSPPLVVHRWDFCSQTAGRTLVDTRSAAAHAHSCTFMWFLELPPSIWKRSQRRIFPPLVFRKQRGFFFLFVKNATKCKRGSGVGVCQSLQLKTDGGGPRCSRPVSPCLSLSLSVSLSPGPLRLYECVRLHGKPSSSRLGALHKHTLTISHWCTQLHPSERKEGKFPPFLFFLKVPLRSPWNGRKLETGSASQSKWSRSCALVRPVFYYYFF